MLRFFERACVSDETLNREFDVEIAEHPFRCTCCNSMKPIGSRRVFVPHSQHFYPNANTRQELAVLSQHADMKIAWCIGCIKGLRDDGTMIDKEDHRLVFVIEKDGHGVVMPRNMAPTDTTPQE